MSYEVNFKTNDVITCNQLTYSLYYIFWTISHDTNLKVESHENWTFYRIQLSHYTSIRHRIHVWFLQNVRYMTDHSWHRLYYLGTYKTVSSAILTFITEYYLVFRACHEWFAHKIIARFTTILLPSSHSVYMQHQIRPQFIFLNDCNYTDHET